VEEKIQDTMASRGGMKHQVLPQIEIQRRHINCISHLVTEQGQMLQNHEDLEQELVSYYQDLLSEPPGDRSPAIEKITQHIPVNITQEQNEALLRPIMIEEVDLALQDTPEGKSPRSRRLHERIFFTTIGP
jgi:hypothetical protein